MQKHKILTLLFFLIFQYSTAQNSTNIEFIFIEKGKFIPGNNNFDLDERNDKKIKVKSFYISKYEITNKEYCSFLNKIDKKKHNINNYINLKGKWRNIEQAIYQREDSFFVKKNYNNFPVIFISWHGANEFCKYYNYRLPSEIEWEYVALKANTTNAIITENIAWYKINANETPHKVGTKRANNMGIHDMSGNVSEWCSNWYSEHYYKNIKKRKNINNGTFKVHRGGSWANSLNILRITNRRASNPTTMNATIGFRVAKTKN